MAKTLLLIALTCLIGPGAFAEQEVRSFTFPTEHAGPIYKPAEKDRLKYKAFQLGLRTLPEETLIELAAGFKEFGYASEDIGALLKTLRPMYKAMEIDPRFKDLPDALP